MAAMKFVTFNLRCVWKDCGGDGKNSFIHRVGYIYDKILEEMPDMIVFQEATKDHLKVMERMLPEYDFYGQFRGVDFEGEGLYTAVKKDRLQVLSFDSYWISPTPYVPGSRYEVQSGCPRICVTVKVRDKISGKIFRSFNIHLDHISDEARVQGMECVLDRVDKYLEDDEIPFIIAGDFNAYPDSGVIKMCNEYKKRLIFDVTDKLPVTFHNWGERTECKIDYIYVSAELKDKAKDVYIWDDVHEGIYFSDHYPVCMEFEL